jgi:predicted metal-dependent hydrolase
MQAGEEAISAFIREKARWIIDKQRQIMDYRANQAPFTLENGQSLLFLGKSYAVLRDSVRKVTVEQTCIRVPKRMPLEGFVDWLREQCGKIIRKRLNYYARLMGVKYASTRLSEAKRRWGSCGSKNNLNFAWRLVMCPQSVIDYVVVHELSHIVYKNHGAHFWSHVAAVMPNFKKERNWLRQNHKLLDLI